MRNSRFTNKNTLKGGLPFRSHLFIISILWASILSAQSDYDLTQRWFNESIYNPAAVGNSFTTGVFLHGREQWLGLDGAPSTQVATFDTYVQEIRSAFGISLLRDKIGYLTNFSGKLAYAYYLPLQENSTLSLGLSVGILNRARKIDSDMIDQSDDPALKYSNTSTLSPQFDFGLEYKGPFKLGASIRNLGFYDYSDLGKSPINVWAYLSSRFNLTGVLSIEPCISFTQYGKIARYESGALFYFLKSSTTNSYNDRFWIGGMYRFHGQYALLAGLFLTPKIRMGYSFDYGVNDLSGISRSGTHELFFSWQFNRIFYKDNLCPAYRGYKKRK